MRDTKSNPRGPGEPRSTTPPPENSAPAPAEPQSPASRRTFLIFVCLAVVAIFAAYANHFHNSFHFDDAHTVVNNVYIRNLHNIPRFFTDASTFSSLPANQTWRPIISLSLAIDYKLGRGLNPLWFHISTFFWFLVQLWLMYLLYRYLMDAAAPRAANRYIALFAVLWYGLHPAIAETVNYIIQRADLYATLGVIAGMVIYIRFPALRKFGIYLLPVILGAMSKATAVVFGGILLVYIFLFEEDAQWNRWRPTILRSLPALAVSAVLAVMNIKLTSKTYLPSTMPSAMYWATQPYVLMKYVRSLFLPLWLSADTDLNPFTGFTDPLAIVGILFCLALLGVAFWSIKRRELRPIAFGIFWYFGASAPTSLFVLSEVENDHRMFFPFVGLMLSATWAAALGIYKWLERSPEKRAVILRAVQVVTTLILVGYALGTWKRNQVWRNEESLFYDVTIKSPQNGRGLMNYGLTQLEKGDTKSALDYFTRATQYTPNYPILEINLGIAYGVLNQIPASRIAFPPRRTARPRGCPAALFLWPLARRTRQNSGSHRRAEILHRQKSAVDGSPRFAHADLFPARRWAGPETARPGHSANRSGRFSRAAVSGQQRQHARPNFRRRVSRPFRTDGRQLSQSLARLSPGQALSGFHHRRAQGHSTRPNYPEAYNNIAADYEDLHQWDPAIEAAKQALKLRPDFQLAKNNLAWSESQEKLNVH